MPYQTEQGRMQIARCRPDGHRMVRPEGCQNPELLEKLERAKGFEPSTPTLAKYFGHFSQTFPSTIICAKSDIYDVSLYDCLRP